MKNLKKLSVVLFATLLSFNFTSCIDDGVSDAVDQVYLAQAEFLKAQGALKQAEAQFQIAKAATEAANAQFILAQAEVELAYARETDAYTAQVEAGTDTVILNNELLAATNANAITLAAETLKTSLATAQGALAVAQSANDVAMVGFADAVKAAKNTLLTTLYGNYTTRVTELNSKNDDRLIKLNKIATAKLFLSTPTTVSLAYVQAGLVADLADLEAGLANALSEITRLEGLTVDSARQDVTDLEADQSTLNDDKDALGVVLAEKENAVTVAKADWLAATNEYGSVLSKEGEIATLEGVIKGHNTTIANAQKAIDKANANIAAIPAAVAALAAVDTTTAYNGVVAAKTAVTAAQALVGTDYLATATTSDNPMAGDAAKTVVTAWDKVWNANLAYLDAKKVQDSADYYLGLFKAIPNSSAQVADPLSRLINWEIKYTATQLALDTYTPTTGTAALLATANLNEAAAMAAWAADPGGFNVIDGAAVVGTVDDLGELGIFTDNPTNLKTYMRVATWSPVVGGNIPATFYPTKYTAADITAISTGTFPITAMTNENIAASTDMVVWEQTGAGLDIAGGATTLLNGGGSSLFISNTEVLDAISVTGDIPITTAYFLEVEADDTTQSKYAALTAARAATIVAQSNHQIATSGLAGVTDARDEAKSYVEFAYDAFNLAFPDALLDPVSDMTYFMDFQTLATANATAAKKAYDDGLAFVAYPGSVTTQYKATSLYEVWKAEKAVADAIAARGTDFRPGFTNAFLGLYDNWVVASALPVTPVTAYTSSTVYERLEGPINAAGDVDNINDLPHVAAGTYVPTAYEELRNAYFEMMWAQEAIDALQTVSYTAITTELGSSNAKTITEGTADIAYINTLLPSHNAALAQLNAELVVLQAAAGGLNELLFDPNDHSFSYTIDGVTYTNNGTGGIGNLGYGPLLVTYLNAIVDRNDVQSQMTAITDEIALIQNSIDHIQLYLLGDGVTPLVENVASFETWRQGAIDAQQDKIDGTTTTDGYILDIEQATVLIAKGMITAEDAQLALEELERELAIIETQIQVTSDSAESILARINALLN